MATKSKRKRFVCSTYHLQEYRRHVMYVYMYLPTKMRQHKNMNTGRQRKGINQNIGIIKTTFDIKACSSLDDIIYGSGISGEVWRVTMRGAQISTSQLTRRFCTQIVSYASSVRNRMKWWISEYRDRYLFVLLRSNQPLDRHLYLPTTKFCIRRLYLAIL